MSASRIEAGAFKPPLWARAEIIGTFYGAGLGLSTACLAAEAWKRISLLSPLRLSELNILRVAVVGTGAMGKNHIRCLAQLPDVVLTGVVEPSFAAVAGANPGAPAFDNCEDLILSGNVDAVIVAAPTECHVTIGKKFLQASIPTLIEKPLASSTAEALELADLSRSTGTPLMVGHTERFNPVVIAAKRCVDQGLLGDIASIAARRVGLAPPSTHNGNNVILDMAVHDLDLLSWLFDRLPASVVARTGRAVGHAGDDYADILLDYGQGSGFVQANWLTPVKIRTLTITGTEAYAELDYITQTLRIYRHRAFSGTASYDDLRKLAGQIKGRDVAVERAEPLLRELQNFVNVARGIEPPMMTPECGAAAVHLAELAMSSAGRPLPVLLGQPAYS